MILLMLAVLQPAGHLIAQENLFRKAKVAVSSEQDKYPASSIVDGRLERASTWMSNRWKRAPHIVELSLPSYCAIDSLVIYTGIPQNELKHSESVQAAGFWCMKNFIIQYWDDANWTDIAETSTSENRRDRVSLHFIKPVTAFRFRVYSTDGEPVRIREIEGYGKEITSLPVPVFSASSGTLNAAPSRTSVQAVISNEQIGTTMQYVAYNQGYLVPGCNAPAWWEYSSVNGARLWADLNTYVPQAWMSKDFAPVRSLEDFEKNKALFLSYPEKYAPLDSIAARADEVIASTNTMALSYAIDELSSLGIDILIQSGIGRDYYKASWQNKWDLWQRMYSFVLYASRRGNVKMIALNNEPNHRNAGPMPLESWIAMSRVASDAIHSAGCKFVGPVTAGTNTDWWAAVAANDHTDYKGQYTEKPVVDIFSTHSYNIPAAGYKGRNNMIEKVLTENSPQHESKPVVYTETGRWMNAYLIDKEETMDSPSLFTEWAGMYVNNMLDGCYGMWAFKFATTVSGTYPWGIKSGHHFVWRGKRFLEDSFENLALGREVRSSDSSSDAARIVDGDKSSAWECKGVGSAEISLVHNTQVGGLVVYTGSEGGDFTAPDRARSMEVEYRTADGSWKVFSKMSKSINKYAQVYYVVDPAVTTDRIRISLNDDNAVKVREVKVFGPETLSKAESCFDVSGAQRTAEVVRLFAKGFKGSRPLMKVARSFSDPDLDICASRDSSKGITYIWLVQRGSFTYNLSLDVRQLGIAAGSIVVKESVSSSSYGEASKTEVASDGRIYTTVPAQSVHLLSIKDSQQGSISLPAVSCFSVNLAGGKAQCKAPSVEMNAGQRASNSVSYISFDLSKTDVASAGRILLSIEGSAEVPVHYRFHVYGFDGLVKAGGMSWAKAPHLHPSESRATDVGADCFIAGQMAFTAFEDSHMLDVTESVKKYAGKAVTFMLIKEPREYGDDYDNGRKAEIKASSPKLIIW